jgi:hypothetical protein
LRPCNFLFDSCRYASLPNDAFAKGPRQEQITAASRHFVALSAARMQEWMASDLSKLDLLVIQIDGIRMDEDLILVAAIGVDAKGDKHPLGLIEGATENAATVQALIDNLVERGLDPAVPRRNRRPIAIIRRSCSDSPLYKSALQSGQCHEHSRRVHSCRPRAAWIDAHR